VSAADRTPLAEFDYELPEESIAQFPIEPRSAARLLDALDPRSDPVDRGIEDLPRLLCPGDVLVVNDSRVLPARLELRKSTGGQVEVLLLAPQGGDPAVVGAVWEALVRPARRVRPGTVLSAADRPVVEVLGRASDDEEKGEKGEKGDAGVHLVRLIDPPAAAACGTVPLPPYIHETLSDPERYQTVYARSPGSVAAPTAGLHFTEKLLERCRSAGATVARLDLAVGLGTFRPMTSGAVEDHVMHAERYSVPPATLDACREARRVVAVGTTALRALETVAAGAPLQGETRLFVHGHFEWRIVDVLLTNFHLPRSSLLVLLDAFAGPRWRELYTAALSRGYRFLSFGDAMIAGRRQVVP
jgi:S-adenosylmethionine:tRNA ribosyltransferase-isomerase